MMLRQTLYAATAFLMLSGCAVEKALIEKVDPISATKIAKLSDQEILDRLSVMFYAPPDCTSDAECKALEAEPRRMPGQRLEFGCASYECQQRMRAASDCWFFSCSSARKWFDVEQSRLQAEATRRGLIAPPPQ
jgi:hypothetical protein